MVSFLSRKKLAKEPHLKRTRETSPGSLISAIFFIFLFLLGVILDSLSIFPATHQFCVHLYLINL